jgi:hypothetical protein
MKGPRWNYVNTLITFAIASAGFWYTQSRRTTPLQTAAVFVGCVVAASIVYFAIDAVRTRNRTP